MIRFTRWFIGEPSPDRWIGIVCLVGFAACTAAIIGVAIAAVFA